MSTGRTGRSPEVGSGNKSGTQGVSYFGGPMTALQTSPLQVKRSSILREFSSVERLHWLMDQNHCNHFPMAVEIRGHTTVTMWRNALDALQRRHPLLNVFIGMEGSSIPAFYQADEFKIP